MIDIYNYKCRRCKGELYRLDAIGHGVCSSCHFVTEYYPFPLIETKPSNRRVGSVSTIMTDAEGNIFYDDDNDNDTGGDHQ